MRTETEDLEHSLAAYRWIKGLLYMADGQAALVEDGAPPASPTVYETKITDQETLLHDELPAPVAGLSLSLLAVSHNNHSVQVGQAGLAEQDYSFFLKDDLLYLKLTVSAQTAEPFPGTYQQALIRFSPSGHSFTGMISEVSPGRSMTYKWDGTVAVRS